MIFLFILSRCKGGAEIKDHYQVSDYCTQVDHGAGCEGHTAAVKNG